MLPRRCLNIPWNVVNTPWNAVYLPRNAVHIPRRAVHILRNSAHIPGSSVRIPRNCVQILPQRVESDTQTFDLSEDSNGKRVTDAHKRDFGAVEGSICRPAIRPRWRLRQLRGLGSTLDSPTTPQTCTDTGLWFPLRTHCKVRRRASLVFACDSVSPNRFLAIACE